MDVQKSAQVPVFNSFVYTARNGIFGSYGNSTFHFLNHHCTVFMLTALLFISIKSAQVFQFLHIITNPFYVLLIVSILLGMWWYFVLVFICISLMVSEVEHLFMCLLAIFTSSLEKHFLKSFSLFIHPVISKSLQPCKLQHLRLPGPSLSSRVCSNSCSLSWWCHPSISSSVAALSSGPQTFPPSGYFPMSRHFASGGQRIEASASPSVIPENIQGRCPLGLTGLTSCCPFALKSLLQHRSWKASVFWCSAFFLVQLSHPHMTIKKP